MPRRQTRPTFRAFLLVFVLCTLASPAVASQDDPLRSWNEGPAKHAVVDFVQRVTAPGGKDFVPEPERIAVFDHDGTLWAEQPLYVQDVCILDRIKALAPEHPEWKDIEPFKSALAGDIKAVLTGGGPALLELVVAATAGLTSAELEAMAKNWISRARHPRFDRLYTDLAYQPMLELLGYLRANGFKTFIVSGGGIHFLRSFAERVYGVPPEQVVGSSLKKKFELRDGHPVIVELPEVQMVNDGLGKPVGIHLHIGRRPIAAFGNSDGDLAMLQWTMAGDGPRFALLVHHTDGEREWAYDRTSMVGRLDKALDEAVAKGWAIVDMKRDWKVVFPFEKR